MKYGSTRESSAGTDSAVFVKDIEGFKPVTLGGYPAMVGNGKRRGGRSGDSASVVSLDSTGKRKSFVRLVTRFAEKTSMQGVPYINNAKLRVAKVIWSVLLLIAIGMMVVHLWYLSNQFFAFPKVTKVSLGFDNLRFPMVTICNTNSIHKGRLDNFNGAARLKDLINDLKPENLVPNQFRDDYDPTATNTGATVSPQTTPTTVSGGASSSGPLPPLTTKGTPPPTPPQRRKRFIEETDQLNVTSYDPNYVERDEDREFKANEFNGPIDQTTKLEETFRSLYMDLRRQDREHLGHTITDMVLSCTFAGRQCEPRMFYLTQNAMYGNCWSLDKDNFQVSTPGPSGGLSLILYLETLEYLDGINNGYGLRLLIHQPNTFPFPFEEGHHVSASFETNVGLKLIGIEREDSPFGDCDPDIDAQFESVYQWAYTRRACQMTCEIEAVVRQCDCFDDTTEELAKRKNNSLKPCRNGKERKCMNDILLKIERKEVPCYCPVPCSELAYEKSFSTRQWPTDSYSMVLLESVCKKNVVACKLIRENLNDKRAVSYNFLKLNVYYEDLNFENITEQPEIETAQYISDVGGAVGLWIGLSILSLCEIIQLGIELCQFAYHKTVKERRDTEKREARHKGRRHSDGDIRNDYREKRGRERNLEGQWNHVNGSNKRARSSPERRDGRFDDLYGDYYDHSYPKSIVYR